MFNFSAEIADAVNYPDIRLFTVAQKWSATELYELPEVEEDWTRPNKGMIKTACLFECQLPVLNGHYKSSL